MASQSPVRLFRAIQFSAPSRLAYQSTTYQILRFYSTASEDGQVASPVPTPTLAPYLGVLKGDLKSAMRAKDQARLGVLRAVLAASLNLQKVNRPWKTNPQLVGALVRMKRSSEQSAEEARQAGRQDLVDHEMEQVAVYEDYITGSGVKVLTPDEMRPIIKQELDYAWGYGDQTKTLMADVIKRVKNATEGQYAENALANPIIMQMIKEKRAAVNKAEAQNSKEKCHT